MAFLSSVSLVSSLLGGVKLLVTRPWMISNRMFKQTRALPVLNKVLVLPVLTRSGPMGEWRRAKTEVSPRSNGFIEPAPKRPLLTLFFFFSGYHVEKRVKVPGGGYRGDAGESEEERPPASCADRKRKPEDPHGLFERHDILPRIQRANQLIKGKTSWSTRK